MTQNRKVKINLQNANKSQNTNKTREEENNEKSDKTCYTFPEKYEIMINRAQIKRLEESEIDLLKEVLEIIIDKQDKMPR